MEQDGLARKILHEFMARGLDGPQRGFQRGLHDLVQQYVTLLQHHAAEPQPGQVHEIVQQHGHGTRLALHDARRLVAVGRRGPFGGQHCRCAGDRRQGVTQFVRQHCQEAVLRGVGRLQRGAGLLVFAQGREQVCAALLQRLLARALVALVP